MVFKHHARPYSENILVDLYSATFKPQKFFMEV